MPPAACSPAPTSSPRSTPSRRASPPSSTIRSRSPRSRRRRSRKRRAAEAVRQRFVAAGLSDVRLDAIGNVLGVRRGRAARPHVVHQRPPRHRVSRRAPTSSVTRTGTVLKGPGIGDDARGLAVLVAIANALARSSIQTAGTVTFAATVGEEGLGDIRGARHLVNTELAGAHRRLRLDRRRRPRRHQRRRRQPPLQGHLQRAGRPQLRRLRHRQPDSCPGPGRRRGVATSTVPSSPRTTFNVGRIGGGTSVNAIPFEAWFEVDLRSVDAAALAALDARFKALVDHAVAAENARWNKPGQVTRDADDRRRSAGRQHRGERRRIVRAARSATPAVGERATLHDGSTDANAAMSARHPGDHHRRRRLRVRRARARRALRQHRFLEGHRPRLPAHAAARRRVGGPRATTPESFFRPAAASARTPRRRPDAWRRQASRRGARRWPGRSTGPARRASGGRRPDRADG